MTHERSVLDGVDRAALVLAVVAGAITVATAEGAWSPFSTFLGALLVALVAGFHRPLPRGWSLRTLLMRVAFGAALSFALLIAAAWPIEDLLHAGVGGPLSPGSVAVFGLLAVILAALEPQFSSLLDKEWGSPIRRGGN